MGDYETKEPSKGIFKKSSKVNTENPGKSLNQVSECIPQCIMDTGFRPMVLISIV